MGKKSGKLKSYRTTVTLILILFELIYVGAIATVLTVAKSECETPLRAWLQTLMVGFGIHLILLLSAECLPFLFNEFFHNLTTYVYAAFSVALSVFTVVWFTLGSFWYYYADKSCIENASEILSLVYWILTIYYVILGLAACGGCLLGVFLCVGGGLTTRSSSY